MGTGRSGAKKKGGFRKFSGKSRWGMEYEGDGKEEAAFFAEHSNADELTAEIASDDDKERAFRGWVSGDFMYGQQYGGFSNMDSEEQKRTRIYDDVLDRATLDQGVELRRLASAELALGKGNKVATLEDLKAMKGRIVTSKGNMSTAAASEGLEIGDSGKNVEYNFKIPGGTTGAGMWIGDKRINGFGTSQREFMMNRDTSFRVGKTKLDKARNVYVVDMEYIGLNEHDYK